MCSVIPLLHWWRVAVDAALQLVRARPAAGSLVLAFANGTRAGHAADRWVAKVVQRVVWNLVHDDVRLHALRIPIHDGVDLPDPVAFGPLDPLCVRARQRLLAADACDPRVVLAEGTFERLDLADVAAAVRVALPQVRSLPNRLFGDRKHRWMLEPEPIPLDETIARLVGLSEEELRVQLDDGDVEAELAEDHVHEDGGLALPRAREAHAVAELRVGPEQGLLGAHCLDVRKLECRRGRQAAPPSACRRATRA